DSSPSSHRRKRRRLSRPRASACSDRLGKRAGTPANVNNFSALTGRAPLRRPIAVRGNQDHCAPNLELGRDSMRQSFKLGLLGLGLTGAVSAIALVATAAPTNSKIAGSKAENFMLADQTGMGYELYYYKNSAAVVIVTAMDNDATSDKAKAAL